MKNICMKNVGIQRKVETNFYFFYLNRFMSKGMKVNKINNKNIKINVNNKK